MIEEALRRDLGLELLERLWERNELSEADVDALAVAVAVAVEASTRSRRRALTVRGVLDVNVHIFGATSLLRAPRPRPFGPSWRAGSSSSCHRSCCPSSSAPWATRRLQRYINAEE